jgi:glycosyltransferase involved in cell wall biosynthesis
MHHYYKVGINLIDAIKKFNKKIKLIVTLHEFLAICANDGQMIKKNGAMCNKASHQDCSICSSTRNLNYSLLREVTIKNSLAKVDKFISPSEFLLDRYVDWGIPKSRIEILENGYSFSKIDHLKKNEKVVINKRKVLRVGFFGQFTPYKGINVFVDAALIVIKQDPNVTFYLYGGSQQAMSDEFNKNIDKIKKDSNGTVNFMGSYDENNVVDLMKTVDLIVIPSKWWENSPVVVDEARAANVPLLVSNHGGLVEKVIRPGFGL